MLDRISISSKPKPSKAEPMIDWFRRLGGRPPIYRIIQSSLSDVAHAAVADNSLDAVLLQPFHPDTITIL